MTMILMMLLVVGGIGGMVLGIATASQATSGVAIIAASACLLILARIIQADDNHDRMMKALWAIIEHQK